MQPQYSLAWNSFQSNICTGFSSLQQNGEFVDMSLAADGHIVKVHQAVVALSSSYLKSIITSTPCQHPVIFLNNISYRTLSLLLEYMYTGEVIVSADNISEFTTAAKSLSIKGLENITDNDVVSGSKSQLHSETPVQADNDLKSEKKSQLHSETSVQAVVPTPTRKVILKTGTSLRKEKVKSEFKSFKRESSTDEDGDFHDFDATMDASESYEVDEKESTRKVSSKSTLSTKLQYSVSIRGSLQIILNRYIYNLIYTRRESMRRWRCVDYRCHKCTAFVITRDNIIVYRANPHNHPFHDKKILSKLAKNMIFADISDVKTTTEIEQMVDDQDKSHFIERNQ